MTRHRRVPHATNVAETTLRYGDVVREISVSGVTDTYAYDALGRQVSHTDGRGGTSRTEYNVRGLRSASIDALGNRTAYAYDRYGNLSAVTNPLGNAVVYEYDLRGRRTYEGGATYPVRYTYDVFGNKTTMTTYRNESLGPASGDVTTWRYDEASNCMTNKVYADGKGPKYGYTQDGKLAQRIWARGIVTDYSYNGWGSLTNTVYSDGTPMVTLLYDAMGRQTDALKECKRQHLELQINQTKKRPQENNFSTFVTTSQNVFESFIRIPSFEEMGGVVIDRGVEHTSIVANQCKCCEIMIVSREWREYESGGTEYGIAQVNLHNRSCEDLKNQAKLVRKIPGVSVSFVYESDF